MRPEVIDIQETHDTLVEKCRYLFEDIYRKLEQINQNVMDFNTGEDYVSQVTTSVDSDEVDTGIATHEATYNHSQLHAQNSDTELDNGVVDIDGSDNTRIGDGGTTNYANFAADGELTLNGTARVMKIIETDNAALGKGATAPTQVIIGNYTAWEYTVGDDSVLDLSLPRDWATGTDLTVKVVWYIDEAYATNSGEIKWQVDWSAIPSDNSEAIDSPTHSGTINSGDVNIPATAKYLTITTVGTISGSSLTANDEIGFTISRAAITDGNNPSGADPAIVHIEIDYIADKLGTAT